MYYPPEEVVHSRSILAPHLDHGDLTFKPKGKDTMFWPKGEVTMIEVWGKDATRVNDFFRWVTHKLPYSLQHRIVILI